MISIIVAISQENAIGKNGQLLCHLPSDLQHFKQITSGKTVVMGERTFFSLPKHPLPNRKNIVLTDVPNKTFEGAQSVYSIEEIVDLFSKTDEEIFIIGGGMVYRQMMPFADKLYITHIHHEFTDADTFFPTVNYEEWEEIEREEYEADERHPYAYSFVTYQRK